MFSLQETFTRLFSKTRDLLDRSERAWAAACQAWNEDIHLATGPQHASSQQALEKAEADEKKPRGGQDIKKKIKLGRLTEIIIQKHDKALDRASQASLGYKDTSRLILWTDGSAGAQRSGYAIAFRHGATWVRITAHSVHKHNSSQIAELHAIDHALDYALQSIRQGGVAFRAVEIFSDSVGSLRALEPVTHPKPRKKKSRRGLFEIKNSLVHLIRQRIAALEAVGVDLELHWVPRNRVLGNILADKGAGMARVMGFDWNDLVVLEFLAAGDGEEADPKHSQPKRGIRRTRIVRTTMAREVSMELASTEPPFISSAHKRGENVEVGKADDATHSAKENSTVSA